MGRDSPQPADAWQDYFCACHLFAEPLQLANGNVAWPTGWTRAQAQAWRRRHGMLPPRNQSGNARKRTEEWAQRNLC